jgi:hypothetical protein
LVSSDAECIVREKPKRKVCLQFVYYNSGCENPSCGDVMKVTERDSEMILSKAQTTYILKVLTIAYCT